MSTRAARLAWSLCALALALIVCAVVLAVLNGADVAAVTFPPALTAGALVGGLVASRRPANPVGWFFLGSAVCLAHVAQHGQVPGAPNRNDHGGHRERAPTQAVCEGHLWADTGLGMLPLRARRGRHAFHAEVRRRGRRLLQAGRAAGGAGDPQTDRCRYGDAERPARSGRNGRRVSEELSLARGAPRGQGNQAHPSEGRDRSQPRPFLLLSIHRTY